jgi:hypothetical protein
MRIAIDTPKSADPSWNLIALLVNRLCGEVPAKTYGDRILLHRRIGHTHGRSMCHTGLLLRSRSVAP